MIKAIMLVLMVALMSMSTYREKKVPLVVVKYYVSVSDGNDGFNGTSTSTPWKTLTKVNDEWLAQTFKASDSILFKAGDTWSGTNLATLSITESGTLAGGAINVSSYGTGAKPLFDGFVPMTGTWTETVTSPHSNIWYLQNPSLGTQVKFVLKNGILQQEGRYPDAGAIVDAQGTTIKGGYLKFEAVSTATPTSITDNELPTTFDWSGYDIVVRTKLYVTERRRITHNPATHVLSTTTDFDLNNGLQAGLGYFFTGGSLGLKTLTQNGEWWYEPSTHRVYMYSSTGTPTGTIEAARELNFIDSYNFSYVHFNNLSLRGTSDTAIQVGSPTASGCACGGTGFEFSNMNFRYTQYGVDLREHTASVFYKDSLRNMGGRAILAYNSAGMVIRKNYIDSVGIFPEQMLTSSGQGTGVQTQGSGFIDSNEIRHVAYNSVSFNGNDMIVRDNLFFEFCLKKNDGAAVYYVRGTSTPKTGWQVINNLAIGNGKAATDGTGSGALSTSGYYFDNDAQNGFIDDNVATGTYYGIYCHRGSNHIITNNLFFNNVFSQAYFNGDHTGDGFMRNITFTGNTLIAATNSQLTLYVRDVVTTTADAGLVFSSIDNNKYWRPRDDLGNHVSDDGTAETRALWISRNTAPVVYDQHSTRVSPYSYTTNTEQDAALLFVYNTTWGNVSETLLHTYISSNDIEYNGGTILKSPLGAYVLFKKGEIVGAPPPVQIKLRSSKIKGFPPVLP